MDGQQCLHGASSKDFSYVCLRAGLAVISLCSLFFCTFSGRARVVDLSASISCRNYPVCILGFLGMGSSGVPQVQEMAKLVGLHLCIVFCSSSSV